MMNLSLFYPLRSIFPSNLLSGTLFDHLQCIHLSSYFHSFIPNTSSDKIALVDQEIHPVLGGRVRFQGSYWQAQSEQGERIMAGTFVEVLGRDNITLVVHTVHLSNIGKNDKG